MSKLELLLEGAYKERCGGELTNYEVHTASRDLVELFSILYYEYKKNLKGEKNKLQTDKVNHTTSNFCK